MQRVGLAPRVLVTMTILFGAESARATTMFNNDDVGGVIGMSIVFTPDFLNGTVSPNCAATGVNQWNCGEGAPVVPQADFMRSGIPLGSANFNFWDDQVGGTISDTLGISFTNVTPTSAHGIITCTSGAGVVAFAPASNTVNEIEGAPFVLRLDGPLDSGILTVATSPVPEPATLTLLGTARRHWRAPLAQSTSAQLARKLDVASRRIGGWPENAPRFTLRVRFLTIRKSHARNPGSLRAISSTGRCSSRSNARTARRRSGSRSDS